MPKTSLGIWSVRLLVLFLILLGIGVFESVVLGQSGGKTIFDNLWLGIPMVGAFIAAFASFLIGIVSIFTKQERSVLVYLAAAVGLLISIFVLGELFFQH